MKIGVMICEYNPLHNGHLYSINKIKEELRPDSLVVIMSGNFTQRGEMAVMNKYVRAKHAILAGADMVIELPTVFATAPAEIFAKGAVKLLSSLQGEKTLCFGIEKGDKSGLIATAIALSSESKEFKSLIKEELKMGHSHAKARYNALAKLNPPDIDLGFTLTPNNILALEYTKAIVEEGYNMDILPILRQGAGYNDKDKKGEFYSASGIRELISSGKVKKAVKFLPPYVYSDLPKNKEEMPECDNLILYSLISKDKRELKDILDCTEGLENRIKALLKNNFTRENLINALSTRRYTTTRLQRIALSSMLNISSGIVEKCLKSDLYLKVLAIRKDKLNLLSSLKGKYDFIMRKADADNLSGIKEDCFNIDVMANDIYNLQTENKTNEYYTNIVEIN